MQRIRETDTGGLSSNSGGCHSFFFTLDPSFILLSPLIRWGRRERERESERERAHVMVRTKPKAATALARPACSTLAFALRHSFFFLLPLLRYALLRFTGLDLKMGFLIGGELLDCYAKVACRYDGTNSTWAAPQGAPPPLLLSLSLSACLYLHKGPIKDVWLLLTAAARSRRQQQKDAVPMHIVFVGFELKILLFLSLCICHVAWRGVFVSDMFNKVVPGTAGHGIKYVFPFYLSCAFPSLSP